MKVFAKEKLKSQHSVLNCHIDLYFPENANLLGLIQTEKNLMFLLRLARCMTLLMKLKRKKNESINKIKRKKNYEDKIEK